MLNRLQSFNTVRFFHLKWPQIVYKVMEFLRAHRQFHSTERWALAVTFRRSLNLCHAVEEIKNKDTVNAQEWKWDITDDGPFYAFYEAKWQNKKFIATNTPKMYFDPQGKLRGYYLSLFANFTPIYNMINTLPQPIAEEILEYMEWEEQNKYIDVTKGNWQLCRDLGLIECKLLE